MGSDALLNSSCLDAADTLVRREPFAFLVAHRVLPERTHADINRDFPVFSGPGFVRYDKIECGRSINQLVMDLTAPAFVEALGTKLGIRDLLAYPVLVEIRRQRSDMHAKVHRGSAAKVATALLHLNGGCPGSSCGCLRFLENAGDVDTALSPEVKPAFGEFVAFAHGSNSRHALMPYQGERRVIQVSWLASERAKWHKTHAGALSRLFARSGTEAGGALHVARGSSRAQWMW